MHLCEINRKMFIVILLVSENGYRRYASVTDEAGNCSSSSSNVRSWHLNASKGDISLIFSLGRLYPIRSSWPGMKVKDIVNTCTWREIQMQFFFSQFQFVYIPAQGTFPLLSAALCIGFCLLAWKETWPLLFELGACLCNAGLQKLIPKKDAVEAFVSLLLFFWVSDGPLFGAGDGGSNGGWSCSRCICCACRNPDVPGVAELPELTVLGLDSVSEDLKHKSISVLNIYAFHVTHAIV